VIHLVGYARRRWRRGGGGRSLKQASISKDEGVGLPPVTATHAPSVGVAVLVVAVGTVPAIIASPGTTPVVSVHVEDCI